LFVEMELYTLLVSAYTILMIVTVGITLGIWIKTKRNHKAYSFLMVFYTLFIIGAASLFLGMRMYSPYTISPIGNVNNIIFTVLAWSLAFISFVLSLWYFMKPYVTEKSEH